MQTPGLKPSLALFAQIFLALVGLAALTFLLGEPHVEGRNAHATLFEIYFHDPFLAYVYVGSISFFVALYRSFALLGGVRRSGTFTPAALGSLHLIQRSGLIMFGFVTGGAVIILRFGDREDRPAGLFLCVLVALVAGAIVTTATLLRRRLERVFSAP